MKIKKTVLISAALVLLLSLVAAVVGVIAKDVIEAREYEKKTIMMNNELVSSGLVAEKIEIEREMKSLAGQNVERIPTVTFLFKKPNRLVYESIRASMSVFGMTGTICLSAGSMPSDEGNITLEQFSGMLSDGYSAAVLYEGEGELSDYLAQVEERCVSLGIEFPNTLYVSGETEEGDKLWLFDYGEDGKPIFTAELRGTLDGYGIKHVVQETYQTKPVSYTDFEGDFDYCEALGFNSSGTLSRDSFLEGFKTRGALVFSVTFDYYGHNGGFYGEYESDHAAVDGTTTDEYFRMLATLNDYKKSLLIASIPAVAEYRKSFNEALDSSAATRLEYLSERLAEVELAIQAIKDKYK